jgi:uncharacterized protein (TIGR02996 family)
VAISDEDALLAAVRAAPADDAPRLVYADWLDEHGRHEQAKLIPAEHRFRQAHALWEELRTKVDPDWVARVFPPNSLILRGYPLDQKIHVIRLIRELTGCGLLEAKTMSESLPARLGVSWPPPALDRVQARFTELGADTDRECVLPPVR